MSVAALDDDADGAGGGGGPTLTKEEAEAKLASSRSSFKQTRRGGGAKQIGGGEGESTAAGDGTGGEVGDEEEKERPPYDEHTQALIDNAGLVRKEYEQLAQRVSDLEMKIKQSEKFLAFDYGPDRAWAPLQNQCVELSTNQYVYRLCPFDRVVQKDRNGHHEITLGTWSSWVGPGPEGDNSLYTAQKYEHGQSCWNGPERSAFVAIECGEELELVEVSEPAKCEYHFRLKSPANCKNPAELDQHIEL